MKTTKTTRYAVLTIGLACLAVVAAGCGPVNVVVGGGGPVAGGSPPPPPSPGPALRLFQPGPGRTWRLGHNYTIRWGAAPFVHNVRIFLSRNNGATWHYIGTSPAHAGVKVVHVPNVGAYVTNHARVRIVAQNHPSIRRTSGTFRITH